VNTITDYRPVSAGRIRNISKFMVSGVWFHTRTATTRRHAIEAGCWP